MKQILAFFANLFNKAKRGANAEFDRLKPSIVSMVERLVEEAADASDPRAAAAKLPELLHKGLKALKLPVAAEIAAWYVLTAFAVPAIEAEAAKRMVTFSAALRAEGRRLVERIKGARLGGRF